MLAGQCWTPDAAAACGLGLCVPPCPQGEALPDSSTNDILGLPVALCCRKQASIGRTRQQ